MARPPSTGPGSSTALARLLATESDLETLLSEARARADSLVREAETRSSARLRALDAELAAEAAAATRRQATECAERIAAISRESDAVLRRFRSLEAAHYAALARWTADRVLQEVAREAQPT
ncbi:MAG TPA: hypothetical protein VFU23_12325 [Gemmatimonadales bacterium]|nr:hypothetical protein [Gemmatimonadales bacterium]